MLSRSAPLLASVVLVLTACGSDDGSRVPSDPTPPREPTGAWIAAAVAGAPLPAVAYETPLDDSGGPGRARIVLDSAHLVLFDDGRYQRLEWSSEFQNVDPTRGAPWQRVLRSHVDDFGTWVSTPTGLMLESAYFQNLRTSGTHDTAADALLLSMRIDLDDTPRPVRFLRRPAR